MGPIWAWRAEAAVIPGNPRTLGDHECESWSFEFECKTANRLRWQAVVGARAELVRALPEKRASRPTRPTAPLAVHGKLKQGPDAAHLSR